MKIVFTPFSLFLQSQTVVVAQLVRASDCGSEGRRFEPGHPPQALHTARLSFFKSIYRLSFSMLIMVKQ